MTLEVQCSSEGWLTPKYETVTLEIEDLDDWQLIQKMAKNKLGDEWWGISYKIKDNEDDRNK